MSWCSDAPEDEAISLFAGLLANPDVPLSQVKLMYNLFFQTSLTLNIDEIPTHLCVPHLDTQIHTYLGTTLNKRQTVILMNDRLGLGSLSH